MTQTVDLTRLSITGLEVACLDLAKEIVRRKVARIGREMWPGATLFQIEVMQEPDRSFWVTMEPLNGGDWTITEPDQLDELDALLDREDFIEWWLRAYGEEGRREVHIEQDRLTTLEFNFLLKGT